MLRLLLVRHGQTEWNAQRRYQGHTNLPLNQAGCEQAQALAARLRPLAIEAAFCSDLLRARQTAEILLEGRAAPLEVDGRLRELNFGALEGHTFDEGLQLWPEVINAWVQDNNRPPEGGERGDDFTARVLAFFQELRGRCAGQTVLVVAHGGPIRVLLQSLLKTGPDVWFNLEHASLTDLRIEGQSVVINRLNDTGSVYT